MNEQLLQAAKLLKEHCDKQDKCTECVFYDIYKVDCGIGYYGYILPVHWEIESEVK